MADCHIELAGLDEAIALAPPGTAWLAGAEQVRLAAITAPLRRRQFLAGRWLLRGLAARRAGGQASHWQVLADDRGQPRLCREDGQVLYASISHSAQTVAVAVAGAPVGLDLEFPGRQRDVLALAAFVFSPPEQQALAALPAAGQPSAFLGTWCLKEAFGKRSGQGLQPAQARRMQARPCDPAQAEAWLWRLPGEGWLALAAAPGVRAVLSGQPAPLGEGCGWCYGELPDSA